MGYTVDYTGLLSGLLSRLSSLAYSKLSWLPFLVSSANFFCWLPLLMITAFSFHSLSRSWHSALLHQKSTKVFLIRIFI